MQTILDVSLLGQGFYHQKARTGVFRVAENLATLLPEVSPDLDVFFSDNIDLLSTIGYLREHFQGQPIQYLHKNSQVSRAEFQHKILSAFPYNSILQKAIKRLFYQINSSDVKFQEQILSNSTLYHSPYFPIPTQIQDKKSLKKLITIHDLIPIKYPQFFENRTDNVVHKIIESIQEDNFAICVSEATKVDLLEVSQLPESQVFVVPLAASSSLFYPVLDREIVAKILSKYAIPINQPYFLSISTLEPRKNIESIIFSFVDLVSQEKLEDLTLVLVGTKGWDFDKIFEATKLPSHIKDRIIFTGYVPDDELAGLYSGALGFVYMSICEGFGLPPLEAMQCGTPVICSNSTSLPEVVGNAGILVSPMDRNALSQAMLNLYKNSTLRNELKDKSLVRASQFSWQKFANQTWDVYKKIG